MKSEWKNVFLMDVLQPKGYIRGPFGSALKRNELLSAGIPVYEQQHAIYNNRTFRFYIDDEKFEEMKRFQVQEDDLIISCSGTVGKVSIIKHDDPKGIISQALLLLRVNKSVIDPEYLKYFFSSSEGYNAIVSRSSGSVQVNISRRNVIEQIPLNLPPIAVQKKIIAILKVIDDKIELNNEINKNLEQQAQAIYNSMFVQNLNPEWQQGCLSDLVIVRYGKDHKKLADGQYPVFGSGGIMRRVERPLYDKESVLIPRKGTLNNVMYVNEPFWSVDTMFYTEMKRPNVAKFVYHFVKSKDLSSMNAGSAVPSMTTDILNALELIIPSNTALKTFEDIVAPMYATMNHNGWESAKLAELRDSLLPRLMSGELDVSDIDL